MIEFHHGFVRAAQQQTSLSFYGPAGAWIPRMDFVALTDIVSNQFLNVAGVMLVQRVNNTGRSAYEAFAVSQGGTAPAHSLCPL